MELSSEFDEGFAIFGFYIGGVNDRETAGGQAFCGDEVQDFEGVAGGGQAILVVADERATVIGGDDFCGQKMFVRESALAGTGRTDEDDEREIGKGELFFFVHF